MPIYELEYCILSFMSCIRFVTSPVVAARLEKNNQNHDIDKMAQHWQNHV